MLTVNKTDLAAINEKLKTLSSKAGKPTVRKAARKAMAPVRDQVQANAPVDTSEDADGIKIQSNVVIRSKWRGDELTMRVGIQGGAKKNPETPFYFRFQEFGTKDIPADPFMGPALESNAQEVLDTVADELKKAIFG